MINDILSLESLKKILEEVNAGIALVNKDGNIIYVNSEGKKLLGITTSENEEFSSIVSCHPYDIQDTIRYHLNNKLPKKSWHRTIYNNGRWVENYLSVIFLTEFEGVIITSKDVTEEVNLSQELEKARDKLKVNKDLQKIDSLTGLYSRKFLDELLEKKREIDAESLGVIMIDVHGFKSFNELLGPEKGDKFLENVARLLTDSILGKDLAIRYGGDEFLLILPDCRPSEVKKIKERIEKNVNKWNNKVLEKNYELDIAVGYTSGRTHELDSLILETEKLMYEDKRRKQRKRN